MSKFAKGKWELYCSTSGIGVFAEDGELAENITDCIYGDEANARLIAAAPEMYKLLEEANQIFYLWRRTNNDEDERRSVIDEINKRYKDFEIHSMNLLAWIDGEDE